jgi:hypothetical protein
MIRGTVKPQNKKMTYLEQKKAYYDNINKAKKTDEIKSSVSVLDPNYKLEYEPIITSFSVFSDSVDNSIDNSF